MKRSTLGRSAADSPRVVLAPAYAIASTDSSPELEYSGWVWPSFIAPHSGWLSLPQPARSRLTDRMSFQPIGLSGQPSASAIGRHIAITIGDSTSGSPDGAIGLVWLPRDCHASLSSVTYAPDAGLNTAGRSVPSRIAVIASPEPTALPVTR